MYLTHFGLIVYDCLCSRYLFFCCITYTLEFLHICNIILLSFLFSNLGFHFCSKSAYNFNLFGHFGQMMWRKLLVLPGLEPKSLCMRVPTLTSWANKSLADKLFLCLCFPQAFLVYAAHMPSYLTLLIY